MTVEALLTNLSVDEKLAAMDILWRALSGNPSEFASPAWRHEVLADRLAHPADGPRISLREARKDVEERRNAGRTQD
jgi:hypothetical protein